MGVRFLSGLRFNIGVMLTKNDLTKLQDIFVTRDEFQDGIAELRSDFFGKFDEVIGEIRAMREEMAAMFYRQQQHTDQIENHEVRLTKLEAT